MRTGFAERVVNRQPHRLAVSFASAHSWFPFWATAAGIDARGQAPRLRWQAHIDQASGWLVPWRLASRRLELTAVKVDGVELSLLREPVATPAAASAPAALDLDSALPVIPPLAAPPPGPPAVPRWTIGVAGYEATSVRAIWIERFRIATAAKAKGALTLHLPTREIELAGTTIEFRDSSLFAGELTLGEALAGTAEVAISRYPYLEERGLATLAHVTAAVKVSGRVSGGRFWFASLPPQAWLQLDDDTAEISGEIRLVEGALQPGTKIEFRQDDYAARAFEFHVTGDVLGSFEVSSDENGSKAEGRVNLRQFGIRRSAAENPDIVGDGLVVVATTRDLQLAELASLAAEAKLDLGQARVPDLATLSGLMPPSAGVALVGGSGRAGGAFDLELPALAGRGAIQIALDDVQVRYGELDLHGRMQIDLALATAALPAGRFDLAGTSIALTEFRSPQLVGDEPHVAAPEVPEGGAGWWARIELPEGEIDLPPEPAASGHLRVRLRDSVPFIGLFETRRNLPRWVERLLTVHDLQAESGFAYADEAFTLDEFSMPFKKATIRARVRFGAEHKTGILLVGWRKLGLGMRFDDERRRLKLLRARDWYAAQGLELSTSEVQVDPAESFSEEALATVTFAGLAAEPLSLADLELAELEAGEEGDESEPAPAPFEIVPGSIARGDLDGDGSEEAAVLLARGGTGESPAFFLAALDDRNGRPENVATLPLGSRPAVGRLRIAGGRIVLDPPASNAAESATVPEPREPLEGGEPPPEAPPETVPPPVPAPELWRLSGQELLAVPAPASPEAAPTSAPTAND